MAKTTFEGNDLFRGLWPHLCWENPRKQADKWNERMLVIPRTENYPDPSIRAIGVGGAITGARHDVHIKDDLVTEEAANSEVVMEGAIRWHVNSRALFDDPDKSVEFVIGTRWAVHDLYSYIMQNDPTVSYVIRSIIEDGCTIYPEAFTLETVARLRKEFGIMFPLLYMNNVGDPDLIDFPEDDLRFFALQDDVCYYDEDNRDSTMALAHAALSAKVLFPRGRPLDAAAWEDLASAQDTYFRHRGV